MNRILIWHYKDAVGNETRIGPTYYVEADYDVSAVRIYAVSAPSVDAEIDVFDDGVSIFGSRVVQYVHATTGMIVTVPGSNKTSIPLFAGENAEELAENFNTNPIEKGSWLHCTLQAGGGKDFTVQLELIPVSKSEEDEE